MRSLFVLAAVALGVACASASGGKGAVRVVSEFNLPAELAETSALYCPDNNSIFTLNDSGNTPIIYQLNRQGELIAQRSVDSKNIDWEALTGDSNNFYIADIGNNGGKRPFVEIKVLPKAGEQAQLTTALRIEYANNNVEQNEYVKHDFDGEALVNYGDSLLLFSKSWQSNIVQVYQVSKTASEQTLTPLHRVSGLPGVVTGVDYNSQRKQFVVVGYQVRGMGSFIPFIALIDSQFKLLATYPLPGFNQVEGVCVSPDGHVWISQESSFFSTHKLAQIQLP